MLQRAVSRALRTPSLQHAARLPAASAPSHRSVPPATCFAHRSFLRPAATVAQIGPLSQPCALGARGSGRGMASASAGQPANISDFDPQLAADMVKKGALLLDVRTPAEYADGSIKGALNISHDQLPQRLGEVTSVTGGKLDYAIVVYCRSGVRSGVAKEYLAAQGYENITNVGGLAEAEEMEGLIPAE